MQACAYLTLNEAQSCTNQGVCKWRQGGLRSIMITLFTSSSKDPFFIAADYLAHP